MPPTYPLPAKPSFALPPSNANAALPLSHPLRSKPPPPPPPAGPSTAHPRAQLPTSGPYFYASPQPASPRPIGGTATPGGASSQAASPKVAWGSGAGANTPTASASAAVASDGYSMRNRRRITKEELMSDSVVWGRWGEGWKVTWRAWTGTSLLSDRESVEDERNGDGKGRSLGPNKRAKMDAFDEMLAEENVPFASTSAASTSTTTSTSLKEKLETLQKGFLANEGNDPVEIARQKVVELIRLREEEGAGNGEGRLGNARVFTHVQLGSVKSEGSKKGKGKAEEGQSDSSVSRVLWVFEVSTEADRENKMDISMEDGSSIGNSLLEQLQLNGLTDTGRGHFTHCLLFPGLYPESSTSTSSSPLYSDPASSTPTHYPSALHLPSKLVLDSSPSNPYDAFLSAVTETLLVTLASSTSDPSSKLGPRDRRKLRLKNSVVFLDPISEPFGTNPRRITSNSVQASFKVSLQRAGLLIQPTVADVALRSYPLGESGPRVDSPIILAPFGTRAFFLRTCEFPTSQETRDGWLSLLKGTGVQLHAEEQWVVCSVTLPAPTSTSIETDTNNSLEVVWPSSLCLLDGNRPQPRHSPHSSPLGNLPPDLNPVPPPTSPATTAPVPPLPSSSIAAVAAPVDIDSRRRFAALLRRRNLNTSTYRDPISSRAEKVGQMLEEMSEELERKAIALVEAEALAAARAAALLVEPSKQFVLTPAGAPVNMRTPISLGGTSTEAPSPADGFLPIDRPIPSTLPAESTKHAEADQLYPSPSEAHVGAGGNDQSMAELIPTTDNSFFDWGDDFSLAGIRSFNLPNDSHDGMMMGLTDDDFSYFDDPAPLPSASTSLPPSSTFGGLQSSGPSPKFVHHFSHLASSTPFPSLGSPTSPFAQASPHFQSSPNPLSGLPFDPPSLSVNALGLGTTPGSPLKTPKTPYSPFVDLEADLSLPVGINRHTLSIAGTPGANSLLRSYRPRHFEPIPFQNSHAILDDKYDPRKGKFGLPSPESDTPDEEILEDKEATLESLRRRRPLSKAKTWYTAICDPRIAAAVALKRKRTPCLSLLPSTNCDKDASKKSVLSRTWRRTEAESDSHGGEDESDDDEMDIDDDEQHQGSLDEPAQLGDLGRTDYPFAGALLLLRDHLETILSASPLPASSPPVIAPKATLSADAALEAAASLIVDQVAYNPEFRSPVCEMMPIAPPKLVSSKAIQLVWQQLRHLVDHDDGVDRPVLTSQEAPMILARGQQSIIQLNPSVMEFWRPMAFEPLPGGKDVVAFAVYEEGGRDLEVAVKEWLKRAGDSYQTLRLGKHVAGTVGGAIEDGLAGLPVGALSSLAGARAASESWKRIYTRIGEVVRSSKHIVIYLLMPPGPVPITAPAPLAHAVSQLNKLRADHTSLLVYPVPLASIFDARPLAVGELACSRFDHLAFAIYDQLLIPISKLHSPVPDTFPSASLGLPPGLDIRLFQSPAITLSLARKPRVEFELQWPPSSLEVMHRHRLLHVGYACSPIKNEPALEWIVVSCIDEKGETWRTAPKLVRTTSGRATEPIRVKIVWSIAMAMAEKVDVEWRMVICRTGTMPIQELQAWNSLLTIQLPSSKRALHVTVTCADLNPPLSVLPASVLPSSPEPTSSRRPSAEEGELSSRRSSDIVKPSHLDLDPSTFAYTPSEPIAIGSGSSRLIPPLSTYIIHVPRLRSYTHIPATSTSSTSSSSSPISVTSLHFLLSHRTKLSTFSVPLGEHFASIRQNFVELAALAQIRSGASGRIPWHLDVVGQAINLLTKNERI